MNESVSLLPNHSFLLPTSQLMNTTGGKPGGRQCGLLLTCRARSLFHVIFCSFKVEVWKPCYHFVCFYNLRLGACQCVPLQETGWWGGRIKHPVSSVPVHEGTQWWDDCRWLWELIASALVWGSQLLILCQQCDASSSGIAWTYRQCNSQCEIKSVILDMVVAS